MAIKTASRPLYSAVRKLLEKQRKINETTRLLSGLDVSIGLLDGLELYEIALDLIGFPPDNTLEFDFDVLNGRLPKEVVVGKQPLRTDFDNMFCRDYLTEKVFQLESTREIDPFIEFLYGKYDELLLEQPEKFSQTDDGPDLSEVNSEWVRIFKEMKIIEPALATIEEAVIKRNKEAATTEIYWGDVWHEIKPALTLAVGARAQSEELASHRAWDIAGGYLQGIATNMK